MAGFFLFDKGAVVDIQRAAGPEHAPPITAAQYLSTTPVILYELQLSDLTILRRQSRRHTRRSACELKHIAASGTGDTEPKASSEAEGENECACKRERERERKEEKEKGDDEWTDKCVLVKVFVRPPLSGIAARR
ncbi:hypothetical protein F2P81_023175 [Scophthalmus maximus]|uniref:Uncharacterized protein n=1 Tax=Scophthalmus maximus TaxID=52904 RepID=A0A6A4RQT3_SCOMX|nr:hypothetical protein F2P81_023175 [Scophthalmus maximus]